MIKEILQEAFLLKTKGFYKHAIEKFYKAIDSENTSLELLHEIAHCYFLMNNEERALNYVEQILEQNPIHTESLKLLKEIFIKKQAWNEAEQTAKNIYTITNDIQDLIEIFKYLNIQRKHEEIFNYNYPQENPDLFYEIAFAYFSVKNLKKAFYYINKALDFDIKNEKYLILKGKILLENNSDKEAYEILKEINYDTENYEVLNFFGNVYQRCGEYKKSIECFKNCLKTTENKDECYYNCGSTYFKMEDFEQAKKYYNLAMSKNPNQAKYHLALANLYYAEKNYKRAYEEIQDNSYESRLLKAIILFDSGYHAISKKEFEKLAEEMPEDDIVKNYLRMIDNELKI